MCIISQSSFLSNRSQKSDNEATYDGDARARLCRRRKRHFGHLGDDGQYYLTSHDTHIANRKVGGGTGVSQRELLAKLQAIRAQRVLLLFNACHSGAVVPTLDAEEPLTGRSVPDEISGALLATGAGRVIITACRAGQRSYVGEGERTIFTQALVDGLHGAGTAAGSGYVSAFDLYTYVYSAVSAQVSSGYRAAQEPELTILKGVGPFAVALAPGATAPGQLGAGAPPAGAAVREVTPEESRALMEQIQSGSGNFGQGNTVAVQGSVVGGDQRNVSIGTYTRARTIDQRQGVVVK